MVTFQQIMFDSLVVLFFVMGIVAAAVGVGLVACSGKIFRLFQVLNRYVSTRQRLKPISVPRDIGPAVQRYRWWFAAAILAGSIYSLYSLTANFDTVRIAAAVVPRGGTDTFHVFMILLVEAARWFMVAMSMLALAVGVLLGFFPNTLERVEAHANRWYSVRKATAGADEMYMTLDRWVEAFPRTAGLAITLGAVIVIVSSGVTLFK